MMRRFLAFCLLWPTLALAQSLAAPHLTANDVLRGEFTETRVLKDLTAPLVSRGSFTIAPRYGLIWKVEHPFALTTTLTAEGLRQETQGMEATNLRAERLPFLGPLYHMLMGSLAGDIAPLHSQFEITQQGTPRAWKATLIPKPQASAMPFARIEMEGGRFVTRVVMHKPDGETDRLLFRHQTLNRLPLTAAEQAAFGPVHP